MKRESPVLLFASDRQESSTYLKRTVTKMRAIYGKTPKKYKSEWGMIVASAGDALVIDEVVNDIEDLLSKKIKPDEARPSEKLKILRKEIGDSAYNSFRKYKERDPDNPPYFELLLGAADLSSVILYVTNEGKQKVLEDWGIIGSGRITGGELLLSEFLKDDLTQKQAARLAALVITRIGNIDLSVGGNPEIKWCRNRRVWHYKEKTFQKIMKESELEWKELKKSWWSQ